ncbi:unnamed protein product [Lathyrus sativus]|nr:unnamed protein product [Lathyrus sativus]
MDREIDTDIKSRHVLDAKIQEVKPKNRKHSLLCLCNHDSFSQSFVSAQQFLTESATKWYMSSKSPNFPSGSVSMVVDTQQRYKDGMTRSFKVYYRDREGLHPMYVAVKVNTKQTVPKDVTLSKVVLLMLKTPKIKKLHKNKIVMVDKLRGV